MASALTVSPQYGHVFELLLRFLLAATTLTATAAIAMQVAIAAQRIMRSSVDPRLLNIETSLPTFLVGTYASKAGAPKSMPLRSQGARCPAQLRIAAAPHRC